VTPSPSTADAAATATAADLALEVLEAVRDYRAAEVAMRKRTMESMRMGENDLRALRHLLKEEREGRSVTPRDLVQLLGMTSSSVTSMLDRLTASGHVRREPHPSDRRRLTIVATPGADEEVRHTLGEMHRRMLDVVRRQSPADLAVVKRFLDGLAEAVARAD